jgi:hypothetical protein
MSITSDPRSPSLPVAPAESRRRRRGGRAPRVGLGRVHRRLIAALHGGELDRRLAAGIDPQTTDVLALRAATITTRRSRTRVADGLAGAQRSAGRAAPGLTASMRPCASELIAAGSVLAVLDDRLRGPDPVNPQGMAMLRELLTEPASPMYQSSEAGALVDWLRTVAATLPA